jgi:hypothetical protein
MQIEVVCLHTVKDFVVITKVLTQWSIFIIWKDQNLGLKFKIFFLFYITHFKSKIKYEIKQKCTLFKLKNKFSIIKGASLTKTNSILFRVLRFLKCVHGKGQNQFCLECQEFWNVCMFNFLTAESVIREAPPNFSWRKLFFFVSS